MGLPVVETMILLVLPSDISRSVIFVDVRSPRLFKEAFQQHLFTASHPALSTDVSNSFPALVSLLNRRNLLSKYAFLPRIHPPVHSSTQAQRTKRIENARVSDAPFSQARHQTPALRRHPPRNSRKSLSMAATDPPLSMLPSPDSCPTQIFHVNLWLLLPPSPAFLVVIGLRIARTAGTTYSATAAAHRPLVYHRPEAAG